MQWMGGNFVKELKQAFYIWSFSG